MPLPSVRRRLGFTIVEVMMASVILVVGFMGMIEAITIGSELLSAAERQTLANQIINHEFDKLRQMPWTLNTGTYLSGLATGTTTLTIDATQFPNALLDANGGRANWTLSRTVTDLSPNGTSLRAITITVTWTKSGTTAAAATATGSALDKLAYFRHGPVSRTYTRSGTVFFGPSGLNLTTQRI
jgi:Tfp pilus assembly protein PilV